MRNVRIAVVEDCDDDANLLIRILKEYESKHKDYFFTIKRFSNAVSFLDKYQSWDIVFMDIELPMMNGMETCYKLREIDKNIVIIFVTNMEQFAVEGYLVRAFDFIVKQTSYNSFAMRMNRVMEYISRFASKTITVKTPESILQIPLQDIKYVDIFNYKLTYHTLDADIEVTTMKLQDVEPVLIDAGFFKCSRSLLVNMKYVNAVSDTDVDIAGEKLPISRRRKKEFLTLLTEYFGTGGGNI